MQHFSTDQKNAIRRVLEWFIDSNKKNYITLGGYAGTGKTTLIGSLRKEIHKAKKSKSSSSKKKFKVAFCSYTGKATRVLETKLKELNALYKQDSISTIHGLIYSPIMDKQESIIGWQKKDEIKQNLIIIDEASMVSEQIWRDLQSYNIPIIAIGDHGQLPPIQGKFNLMSEPDLQLTQIHRQAKQNPIIDVSIQVRRSGSTPIESIRNHVGKYTKIIKSEVDAQEEVGDILAGYDTDTLILCGYNSTRIKLNNFIRESLGFESPVPTKGDRVICLRNNHIKGIYNGMLGTILYITKHDKTWYDAEIQFDDSDKSFSGLIAIDQFNSASSMSYTQNRNKTKAGDLFDFGYAITVHKAQGSQARKVILLEEKFKQMSDEMWRRWLYTGVTRAEEELVVVGEINDKQL